MIDTKELRRLAQAATPHVGHACKYQDAHWLREGHVDFENADLFIASERPHEDAAFYAAANPAAVSELLDRLEAAEKERDALRAEVIHIKEVEFPRKAQAVADGWRGKCERLEAKIAEMEKQEPYAFAVNFPETSRVELVRDLDEVYEDLIYEAHEVRKLYTLPGAKGEEK